MKMIWSPICPTNSLTDALLGRPRGPVLSRLVRELRAREGAALALQVFQGVILLIHQAGRRMGLGGRVGLQAVDGALGRSSLEGSVNA